MKTFNKFLSLSDILCAEMLLEGLLISLGPLHDVRVAAHLDGFFSQTRGKTQVVIPAANLYIYIYIYIYILVYMTKTGMHA